MTELEWILLGVGAFIILALLGIIIYMYRKCYQVSNEPIDKDYDNIPEAESGIGSDKKTYYGFVEPRGKIIRDENFNLVYSLGGDPLYDGQATLPE